MDDPPLFLQSFSSVVPQVILQTPMLDYKRCFVGSKYVKNVELWNPSSLPVKYRMKPQFKDSTIECSTAYPEVVEYMY